MDTVDKHGRTIILACALVFDETEESFIWIFEKKNSENFTSHQVR